MSVPADPKIYHIVHLDRLLSIIAKGGLLSDTEVTRQTVKGTTIGMNTIKQRRMTELQLASHPGLYVGSCVPFYFCPRSIMLYLICQANHPDLAYRGGQGPILHLEADLKQTVAWAKQETLRWAFTLSNAGARYFEDRADLGQLGEVDWNAVQAASWQQCKEGKQAEFLVELWFPWILVSRIGVQNALMKQRVDDAIKQCSHRPRVEVQTSWYY